MYMYTYICAHRNICTDVSIYKYICMWIYIHTYIYTRRGRDMAEAGGAGTAGDGGQTAERLSGGGHGQVAAPAARRRHGLAGVATQRLCLD